MNNNNLVSKLEAFSKTEFVKFLKTQSTRRRQRTRLIGGEKTIQHNLSLVLTRHQWHNVMVKCADLKIGYGVFIKLLINQYFGLSPNLDDFEQRKR